MYNKPKNKIYNIYRFIHLMNAREIQKKLQNKLNGEKFNKNRDIKGIMKYPRKKCVYKKKG